MERLLDNDTRRRLRLIEFLYATPGWQTTKILTKRLNCSESVLLKDITKYNSLFQVYKDLPEYYLHLHEAPLEIQTSHYGIQFIFPSGLGLDFFYQFVLKTTPAFQLLELIFFDETLSVAQLADKLYFSVPTVYRLITKINQALLPFAIELRPNPCHMTGAEQQIRYFYNSYFLEAYQLLEWPFPVNEERFKQLLLALYDDYAAELDVASFRQLKIRTAVQLIRYQQGHRVTYPPLTYQHLQANVLAVIDKTRPFTSDLGLKADSECLVDVFGLYLIAQRTLDDDNLFQKLATLVLTLAQTLHLSTPDNHQEIATRLLITSHLTTKFATGPNFILYNSRKAFVSAIAENHPCVFAAVQKELITFLQTHLPSFTPWLINDLLYTLFISWPDLFMRRQPVHLLIVSTKHLGHAALIQDQLHQRYGQRVYSEIYQETQLSYELLRERSFDILISDSSFFFPPPQGSIWLNGYPTFGDWARIEQMIHLYEQRAQAPETND